ncbi:hypothetical protein AUJ77_00250 [Candidatus Nomurabacteria bacterium CG1_02_43_90]|uniref:PKD domain-containing protein n=1 Tax=Candidatus Nomurabacteria bacterium CG1_02_43_90 TaxID=1805281 RepID=A0A1J4V5E2_9BACT|nr:MAG: hypothetical protein AUJ77_00250 [Candidatus Nomurabacteria bacterium CG1_02_43_90]
MRTIGATLFFLFAFVGHVSASVVINEIAWMGTAVSPSNEWIEIANTGNTPSDLNGWTLSLEGKKDIILSGSIAGGGYYLIERTDDTTVPNIPADLISSFGTGIPNTGAVLSLKDTQGTVVDRVDGSNGWNIGGNIAGDNTTKETAQRGANGWYTSAPTPRALNGGAQNNIVTNSPSVTDNTTNTTPFASPSSISASFPVDPQIFADAGTRERTISAGATVTFLGRVFGLKKEPIENARISWSFGDGGMTDGTSVSHIFYYPGDYIVVLDASSGYYSASDRVSVHVVTPVLSLRTGGDEARSFIALENEGSDEVDLSLWQIEGAGKIFILPQHTIVGARKTLTLPSEITGIVSPKESIVFLRFPNGTRVEPNQYLAPPTPAQKMKVETIPTSQASAVVSRTVLSDTENASQEAVAIGAFDDTTPSLEGATTERLWPWYVGAAFLALFAIVGAHFAREQKNDEKRRLTADDFEIEEDKDPF